MADPALGSKQICPNCQAKFYDLGRRPAHCPKCESEFDPEEAVKFRRIRARTTAGPDYEDAEEAEPKVKASDSEDELEDEEVRAPEIDEGGEEDAAVGDEEEDLEPAVVEEAPEADVEIEEDVDIEEDDAVPFLEEDEEGFEEEIEGLPEEGDEDR